MYVLQKLRIYYKTAYYMRNIRPFDQGDGEKGDYKEFKDTFENKLNEIDCQHLIDNKNYIGYWKKASGR